MMSPNPLSDQELVSACLSIKLKHESWQELHDRCHVHLLGVVRRELRAEAADEDRVQEVVQNLWCTLYAKRRELLGPFDERRGTIQAYLAKLARRHAHWGSQGRRRTRNRERALADVPEERLAVSEIPLEVILEEFAECLTPAECDFFMHDMCGKPRPCHCKKHSESYGRVFISRIYDKWRSPEL